MNAVRAVEGLTVALPPGGDRPHAVEPVDFTFGAGEILCIGADRGAIHFGGTDLRPLTRAGWKPYRRRISGVPGPAHLAFRTGLNYVPSMTWRHSVAGSHACI